MNHKNKKNLFFLFFYLIILLTILIYNQNTHNKIKEQKILGEINTGKNLKVYVLIGKPSQMIIYGYTSPFANVFLQGITTASITTSDKTGYFSFVNFSITEKDKELCIHSTDNFGRITPLNCIKLANFQKPKKIGPIILSPTISLNKSIVTIKDEIIISGQSIPNSTVVIKLFEEKKGLLFKFIRNVFAQEYPKEFVIQTDTNGNFSLKTEANEKKILNLYSYALFENFTSPQSFKLNIEILGFIEIFFLYVSFLFLIIKKHVLDVILIGQIILISFFIYKSHLEKQKEPKAIILFDPHWISIQKYQLKTN